MNGLDEYTYLTVVVVSRTCYEYTCVTFNLGRGLIRQREVSDGLSKNKSMIYVLRASSIFGARLWKQVLLQI